MAPTLGSVFSTNSRIVNDFLIRHSTPRFSEDMIVDLEQAAKALRRAPRLSFMTVALMATAIAAVTTVFSIVAVIYHPTIPGDRERTVRIFGVDARTANDRGGVSFPDFLDLQQRTKSFELLAARLAGAATVTERGRAHSARVSWVTPSLFQVCELKPIRGRLFASADARASGGRVAVLSYGYWRSAFAGDEGAVGTMMRLDGAPTLIVGIVESRSDLASLSGVQIWLPLDVEKPEASRAERSLTAIGLLRPGATVAEANREVGVVAPQLARESPATNGNWTARVTGTAPGRLSPQTSYNLTLLSCAAGIVFLVGCADVTLLLLMRNISKQREDSIRLAVGASRLRLVCHRTIEGLLLAVPAAAIGATMAVWIVSILRAASSDGFLSRMSVDWTTFAFTAAVSVATPVVFAVAAPAPATPLTSGVLLSGHGVGSFATRTRRRQQRALAATLVATSLALLIVTGLIAQSFVATLSVDPGVDATGLVVVPVEAPRWKYADARQLLPVFAQVLDRLGTLPGARDTAAVSAAPAVDVDAANVNTRVRGCNAIGLRAGLADYESPAELIRASAHAFSTLGIPTLAGREFSPRDDAAGEPVAIVNRAFGARCSQNPVALVDALITIGSERQSRRIVGMVADTLSIDLTSHPARLYVPVAQDPPHRLTIVVRGAGLSAESIASTIAAVDSDIPIEEVQTFEGALRARTTSTWLFFLLVGGLAIVAILLAVGGVFTLFSFMMAQRRGEFAIRLALGASTPQIARVIVTDGCAAAIPGMLVGVAAGGVLSGLAVSSLYGVPADRWNPFVYGGCIALIAGACAAALAVPMAAVRRIRPQSLLR
jgi:putative ABC transport system permease protein